MSLSAVALPMPPLAELALPTYLGLNPFLGAAVFAILTGTSIEWISNKGKMREDSAIAILWSLGMALGIIFCVFNPRVCPQSHELFFGSILSVGMADVYTMLALTLLTGLFFLIFYRPILYSAFDAEFSKINGLKVAFFRYTMAILVALAIVISIRAMGIILVLSSLYHTPNNCHALHPPISKNCWTGHFFGLLGSLLGLFAAYAMNIPSGATIIFSLTFSIILLKGIHLIQLRIKQSA
jgi:zinc transport system permease protein